MKKLNVFLFVISAIFIMNFSVFAQQDYQIVQKFKEKYKQLEQSIKSAESQAQLDSLETEIEKLRSEYQSHEELLNSSLYPDDFNSTLEKLDSSLMVRKGDYTQITTLQGQISGFKIQIEQLNQKNADLLNKIQLLQDENTKNIKTIARLQRNISELRYSLRRRDMLVMTMLDSLMPSNVIEDNNLTANEKQKIYAKAKNNDLIANIKKSISDNVRFLQVTSLSAKDLSSLKKQQRDFEKLWHSVGPEITSIYSARKENVSNLKNIDSAFAVWREAINQEAWFSIRHEFSVNGINLNTFNSGQSFVNTVSSYIDDEIKNASINNDAVKADFHTFSDSVWFKTVKPNWVPYLIENGMITDAGKDTIEAKIAQWKAIVSPSSFNWLYVIIAALIIIIIFMSIKSGSAKKAKPTDTFE